MDLCLLAVAALFAVFVLLQRHGRVTLSGPVGALLLIAWCPLFWGKYWIAKREGRRLRWPVLACALVLTLATALLTLGIMVRLAV